MVYSRNSDDIEIEIFAYLDKKEDESEVEPAEIYFELIEHF